MHKAIVLWMLVLAMLSAHVDVYAEDLPVHQGVYIQYDDEAGDTIYAPDGRVLYAGVGAWRDVDQRVKFWGDDSKKVVLDDDGNVISDTQGNADAAVNDTVQDEGHYSVEKTGGKDGTTEWWRVTDEETGRTYEIRSKGRLTVTPQGYAIANTILESEDGTTAKRRWLYRIGTDGLERLDDGQWYDIKALDTGEGGPVRFIALRITRETVETAPTDIIEESGLAPRTENTVEVKRWFLLDEAGKRLNEADLSWISRDLAAADYYDGLVRVQSGDLYGYMDIDGKMVIPAEYAITTDFCNDHAVVFRETALPRNGDDDWFNTPRSEDGEFFLVDTKGNLMPVENLSGVSDAYHACLNIAEYCGCAQGYRWGF